MLVKDLIPYIKKSHPSRGGWIEIDLLAIPILKAPVPPLTGWVD